MDEYTVYVLTDTNGRITSVNSSDFLRDADGWTEIDSGSENRHRLAQRLYFPLPIIDEETGVLRYKLEDGKPVERSQEEMDADYAAQEDKPTTEQRLAALEEENKHLKEALDLLLSGATKEEGEADG